jgi:ABC-type multidrug transport system ATPase subunit/ABC-type multidrug transport system permease subunit
LNGEKASKSVRRFIAFVHQDDVMMPHLTVYETIKFQAMLRMPKEMKIKDKIARCNALLQEFELMHTKDTAVGAPGIRKGISGGERKRLAIAIEMLNDPSVLILDEPTSGLDAFAALSVIHTLRQLAKSGRAVILTIHQPRSNIFQMFDKLLLLAKGHVVYFDDAQTATDYFEKNLELKCPDNYNPADYLLDIIAVSTKDDPQQKEADNVRIQKIIDYYESNVKNEIPPAPAEKINFKKFRTYQSRWLTQFLVIYWRSTVNIARDKAATFARVFQTVVLAVVIGLIYLRLGKDQRDVQNRAGVLFFMIINTAFSTMFSSLALFPQENPVFLRERASRAYHVSAYFFGKALSDLPLAIIFPIIFGLISYWMVGLNPDAGRFFRYLFILEVTSLTAQAIGQAISAAVSSQQVANALAPLVTIIFLLTGGFYINADSIPNFLIWLYWISIFHYSYEAAFLNEFQGQTYVCPPAPEVCQYTNGQDVINFYSFNNALSHYWIDVAFLAAIFVVCRILAYVFLKVLKRPRGG